MMSGSVSRRCPEVLLALLLTCSATALCEEPPAGSPTLTFSAQSSAAEMIVGEPLELDVKLRWSEPVEGVALITAASFLEILVERDGTSIETPAHWRENTLWESGVSSWEKETIVLSFAEPEWRKCIKLEYQFPLDQPGSYKVTARWRPEAIQPYVRERMKEQFNGQHLVFLEQLKQEVSSTTVVTCPRSEADKKLYLEITGAQCPEGTIRWPDYAQPPNDAEVLVEKHAASTYAAYILSNRIPDYEDWRYTTKPPEEFARAALGNGPGKEPTPKWERVFRLLEINLRSGNTPKALRSRFWMYYGERLLLRGRVAEAREAFEHAVSSSTREGSVYMVRSRAFLEALDSP